jgi:hypothetical protein
MIETPPKSPGKKMHSITGPLPKDSLREVLRMISAKRNCLTEIFPEPVFIGLTDLSDLNRFFGDKFKNTPPVNVGFNAIVAFENYRSRDFKDWQSFQSENWAIPEVVESLVIRWDFWFQFEENAKPCQFQVTLRCGGELNPAAYMQYVFSKNDEDIDKIETLSSPMSCKVEFSDPSIGQELLDLIARWHKGRKKVEVVVPGVNFVKKNRKTIFRSISFSIPTFTFGAALSIVYYSVSRNGLAAPIDNQALSVGLVATCCCIASWRMATVFCEWFCEWLDSNVRSVMKMHTIALTNGDRIKQDQLFGGSKRSFIKFISGGVGALLWDVGTAYICYRLFGS